jgi:RimJ/RimL family protein N-acetyltransferase
MSFRPVERQDLVKIRHLRNDPSTWVHLTDPRPLTEADQEAWIGGIGARTGKFYFVASDDKRPFIGLVRMDEFDPLNRSIRVGADVVPELRNKGYGILIYRTIKKYCFDHLNVHRVWLEVLATNEHAGRLYAKQGFVVEGRLREAVYRDGKFVDYVIMSILEPEYRNLK